MKKIIFAVAIMSSFSFPPLDSYGQNLPAQTANKKTANAQANAAGDLINLLLLSDFALYSKPEDIFKCAGRMLERAGKLDDPALRRIVVFSLSKIQNAPGDVEKIRQEHLIKISDYFATAAFVARDAKRPEDALYAVQIAVRCDPANANARLLFASLLAPEPALQTLHYGIKYLDIQSEIAPKYFNQYFLALSNLQQDRIAAQQGLALLTQTQLPDPVRIAVANHTALALYAIGDYQKCIETLDSQKIANAQQAMILKARALFDSGKTKNAIDLLDEGLKKFPAEKRDTILSQITRFYSNLGDLDAALKSAMRRIQENPNIPAPYLQRLYLYNRAGDKARFDEELEFIFKTFSSSQTALIMLANFSAENGRSDIVATCTRLAIEKKFPAQIFIATELEAQITAGTPAKAIESYIEITSGAPKIFSEMESAISAILAAAYARAGTLETDPERKKTLHEHAERLLAQYFSDSKNSPENFISVTHLFHRIHENAFALNVARHALNAFPWHSQIRANAIALRIEAGEIFGGNNAGKLSDEIRILTNMRRPNPEIWRKIMLWLATAPALPAGEIAELKKIVAPLVRADLAADTFKDF